MDIGKLNFFLKLIEEEYRLTRKELQKISRRLMADEVEFEKVWEAYRNKSRVNEFRPLLAELLMG